MTTPASSQAVSSRCTVYLAADLRVESGALAGDAIGGPGEVVIGDVFALLPDARPMELVLRRDGTRSIVGPDSSVGHPGQLARPLARHQVMGTRGAQVELLLLSIEGRRFVLPLGPLAPSEEYTLIATRQPEGELSGVSQVSFTRGTRVTLGDGRQSTVEALRPGERVLTRDHGPQPIRWCGRQTIRAEGSNAVVVIAEGALHNARDLVLSPDHRLFVYQRQDRIGAGRAEVLVRARHLVNGEDITWGAAGDFDFFHLLFDEHEIIYVEGIATESLLVTPDVLAGMGEDLARDLRAAIGAAPQVPHHGCEPAARDLAGVDAAALLRRASRG